ncbi:MAG: DUF1801 domain-containing protein [Chitinophagales bacterium]
MKIEANTVEEYVSKLPEERQTAVNHLREIINKNIPKEFEECLNYGMLGYVIPLSYYPKGYHCKKDAPLPFMNIASQKNFVAVYHMGIYTDEKLMDWFATEYPKHCKYKLDMGKSCIRFKKIEDIPYKLIGQLASKMTADDWIAKYEAAFLKK